MRDEKTCPDCAERVLAQARVCRYCGYRFAGAPPRSLLDWFRRPADPKPLPELLLDWGTELSADEEVAFFGLCDVESDAVFVLVTNRRLVFFTQRGARKLLEWTLEAVHDVEIEGRGRGASLRLSGELGSVTLRHFVSETALREAADALAPARGAQG